jgi:hypothetical protein
MKPVDTGHPTPNFGFAKRNPFLGYHQNRKVEYLYCAPLTLYRTNFKPRDRLDPIPLHSAKPHPVYDP